MGTTLFSSCSFSRTYNHKFLVHTSVLENGKSRVKSVACSSGSELVDGESERYNGIMKRRSVLLSGASLISSTVFGFPGDGYAAVKQGLLAGRIPGLSEPDEQGWF